jgi:hypothetical protein
LNNEQELEKIIQDASIESTVKFDIKLRRFALKIYRFLGHVNKVTNPEMIRIKNDGLNIKKNLRGAEFI